MTPTSTQFIAGIATTITAILLNKLNIPNDQIMMVLGCWGAVVGAHVGKDLMHAHQKGKAKL